MFPWNMNGSYPNIVLKTQVSDSFSDVVKKLRMASAHFIDACHNSGIIYHEFNMFICKRTDKGLQCKVCCKHF